MDLDKMSQHHRDRISDMAVFFVVPSYRKEVLRTDHEHKFHNNKEHRSDKEQKQRNQYVYVTIPFH